LGFVKVRNGHLIIFSPFCRQPEAIQAVGTIFMEETTAKGDKSKTTNNVLDAKNLSKMNEAQAQAFHDTLSKLRSKGRGGLGMNELNFGNNSADVDYGLPKNALYANFVPEMGDKFDYNEYGDGRIIKRNFDDCNDSSLEEESNEKKRKRKRLSKEERKAEKKAAKLEAKRQAKLEEKLEEKRRAKLEAKKKEEMEKKAKNGLGSTNEQEIPKKTKPGKTKKRKEAAKVTGVTGKDEVDKKEKKSKTKDKKKKKKQKSSKQ